MIEPMGFYIQGRCGYITFLCHRYVLLGAPNYVAATQAAIWCNIILWKTTAASTTLLLKQLFLAANICSSD